MSACAALGLYGRLGIDPTRHSQPTVIYISDFTLHAGSFRQEHGILPIDPITPLGSVIPRAFGVPEDPSLRARELVDLMSSTLKEDLINAGFDARRIHLDGPLPTQGWLVRGTFTDMNEGNRLGRAIIGLGAGKTHFQVFAFLDQLAPGAAQPAYALSTSARSSAAPGAMFSLSPIVAAERFISGGLDLDSSMVKTASEIAQQIAQHVQSQAGVPI